jgi:5-methylcytosine-specific restriction enzyme A
VIASQPLEDFLTTRFGLAVTVDADVRANGQCLKIRPADIEETIGFRVEVLLGWRSIEARFIPDNYASGLLSAMRQANADQKAAFVTFAGSILSKGADFDMHFGQTKANPLEPSEWPSEWHDFSISMQRVGLLLERGNSSDSREAYPWIASFFGTTLSLLPLEPVTTDDAPGVYEEGAAYLSLVKKYERSRINRAACIEIHGTRCKICGIDMGEEYGPLGEGFIHVHHITPVSLLGEGYVISPGNDLIPVCPNCHSIVHRKYPPYGVNEIREVLGTEGTGD